MNAESPILSAQGPRVTLDGIRARPCPPVCLPSLMLGVGEFSVEPHASGLPMLIDPKGMPCGVFANAALAEQTRASLSQ